MNVVRIIAYLFLCGFAGKGVGTIRDLRIQIPVLIVVLGATVVVGRVIWRTGA